MRTAGNVPGQRITGRNLQRVERIKKREKRLLFLNFFLMGLLIISILFLFSMYRKTASLSEQLNRAAVRLQLPDEESGQNVYQDSPEYQSMAEEAMTQTIQKDYPDIWGLEWVDKPVERTEAEVLEKLARLAEDDSLIADICENWKFYPDKLLEALANNPEMEGFVEGYLDKANQGTEAGLTESEREKDFPLFLQWDPRWGYEEYGDDSIIGISGCGPACISMALYYLTGDESLTPDRIANYSMKNGYYVSGVGTAWALLEDVPALYGIHVTQQKIREYNLRDALDEGSIIICSMSAGDFTASGHFIVIYGYDEEGYLINDPNCVARSREHWSWDRLEKQIKNIWIYSSGQTKVMDYDSLR